MGMYREKKMKWKPTVKLNKMDIELMKEIKPFDINKLPPKLFKEDVRELVHISLMTRIKPAIDVVCRNQRDIYYLLNEIQGVMTDLVDDVLKDSERLQRQSKKMKSIGFMQED